MNCVKEKWPHTLFCFPRSKRSWWKIYKEIHSISLFLSPYDFQYDSTLRLSLLSRSLFSSFVFPDTLFSSLLNIMPPHHVFKKKPKKKKNRLRKRPEVVMRSLNSHCKLSAETQGRIWTESSSFITPVMESRSQPPPGWGVRQNLATQAFRSVVSRP